MKILGKSDNNPDHLDIGVGRDIGDEGKRDVARIFSGMGQCDEFDQHVVVGRRPYGSSDPRPPWGLAGCCQLDPSHPTSSPARLAERVVTPTPQLTLGANHFPATRGDCRFCDLRLHRAPGRGGRRASIPLPALTTLLSALAAFCLCEFRVSQQISTFYGPSVQTMETRLGARQRRRPPAVHRGSTHAPRLQRPVASEEVLRGRWQGHVPDSTS